MRYRWGFGFVAMAAMAVLGGCQSDKTQVKKSMADAKTAEPVSVVQAIRSAPGLKSTETSGRQFERKRASGAIESDASDAGDGTGNSAARMPKTDLRPTTGTAETTGIIVLYPDNTPLAGASLSVQLAGTTQSLVSSGTKTLTAKDGSFRLTQLPAGKVEFVIADAQGKLMYAAPGEGKNALTVALQDTQTTSVRLRVFPGYRIAGTVFDKDTSEPLAGVELKLIKAGMSTATDADGHYRFEGVPPSDAAWVSVTLAGFMMFDVPRVFTSDGILLNLTLPNNNDFITQDIPMVPVVHVSGRVEDSKGKPVAGADLTWRSSIESADGAYTESDTDGNFVFKTVPFQQALIEAQISGYAFYRSKNPIRVISADIENVKVVLDPSSSVEGRVVNSSGEGIVGAAIGLNDSYKFDYKTMEQGRFSDNTGADGTFLIKDRPAGLLNITVYAEGYGTIRTKFDLKIGEKKTGVEIKLNDELTIEGRVVDENGKPLQATVYKQGLSKMAKTDSEGKFVLGGLPEGKVSISASTSKPDRSKEVIATAGDRNVVIRMDPNFVVHGKVIDNVTREPISDFKVTDAGEVWSDGEGPGGFRFLVTVGDNSLVMLTISSKGYASQMFEVKSKRDTADLKRTFELGKGGGVRGRVINASDKTPVGNVAVTASDGRGFNRNPAGKTYSDAEGAFVLAGLPSGFTTVKALPELPMVENSKTITVRDGEISDIGDIEIGKPGGIHGQVVDAQGNGVANTIINLSVSLERRKPNGPWVTDSNGKFSIVDLDPGMYIVYVGENRDRTQNVTVEAGKGADVVIRLGSVNMQGMVTHNGVALDAVMSVTHIDSDIAINGKITAGRYSISGLMPGQNIVSISVEQIRDTPFGTSINPQKVLTDQVTLPDEPMVTKDFVVTGPVPKLD